MENDVLGLNAEYPTVVTPALLAGYFREIADDWRDYAIIYPHLVELFNLSPTMAICSYRGGVPTISVDEMVTLLKHRCPELQLLIDDYFVRLLATIFSWKTGAIITNQFIEVNPDLPLLAEVLEEAGCFN